MAILLNFVVVCRYNPEGGAISGVSVIFNHINQFLEMTRWAGVKKFQNVDAMFFRFQVYKEYLKGHSQVWWILFLLLLTSSASTCLQHSRNLGLALMRFPVCFTEQETDRAKQKCLTARYKHSWGFHNSDCCPNNLANELVLEYVEQPQR